MMGGNGLMISIHKKGREQHIKLQGEMDSASLNKVFDLIGNLSQEASKICIDTTGVRNTHPANLIAAKWAALGRSFLNEKTGLLHE